MSNHREKSSFDLNMSNNYTKREQTHTSKNIFWEENNIIVMRCGDFSFGPVYRFVTLNGFEE